VSSALPLVLPEKVLLTGICGRLGRRVARELHRRAELVGLDEREFVGKPKDVEHHRVPLTSHRLRDVIRASKPQAVVHLGFSHNPREVGAEHHRRNVLSTQGLLSAARELGVAKVVLLSSANVYGPRPDNAQFLTESAPLLGASSFSDMRDLVEVDMLAQSFLWQHSAIETVVLRPTHILGTVHNAPSNYLRLGLVPTLLGFDPMVQFIHQQDVVRALLLALTKGARGVFNLAGPPPLALSRALALLGRQSLAMPHKLAMLALDRLFRFRITNFPAPELDFIRYICMVDDTKARRELGYSPSYDTLSTLMSVDEERWVT
jgi:UDP-glucose 4-epimerase